MSEYRPVTFRPDNKTFKILARWRRNGYNISKKINEAIEKSGVEEAFEDLVEHTRHGNVHRPCQTPIGMSNKHDSLYCPNCDVWISTQCKSLTCQYCSTRPDKPSEEKK